jgi:trigger factor
MLERIKPRAERRVRVRLIFDKIAAQENISVDQAEVEQELATVAERSKHPVSQVRQYYEDNNLMPGVKRQLRDKKVMQLIVDAANLIPASGSPDEETS